LRHDAITGKFRSMPPQKICALTNSLAEI
jgi:hypothetical protein